MATVINRSRTHQTVNVPCKPGCNGTPESGCLCSPTTFHLAAELEDGTRGIRVIERKLAGSITFLAGESKAVPEWVLQTAPMKAALAKGRLRLLKP